MMKKVWLVPVVLAGGIAVTAKTGGCLNSKDPDEKLAGHFEDLCKIADAGADDPVKGVKKLGNYFGDHTDDMFGEFGGTLATIEKVSDDDEHDARAHLARDRMVQPWIDCIDSWARFGEAIEDNPEAGDLFDRGVERIGRTLEIIFGEGVTLDRHDVRVLPALIQHRIETITK